MTAEPTSEQTSPIPPAKPEGPGLTTRVFKGSIWTFLGQVVPMLAAIVSTPFVIRFLGSESYGALILVGLIPMYFSFADFGMGMASTRFGSEAFGNGEVGREASVIRTAAVIALASAFVFCAPIFLFSSTIAASVNLPLELQADASRALKITVLSFFLSLFSSIFNTAQLSRLRMDLNSMINAGGRLLVAVITPIVLFFQPNILAAAIVGLAGASLTLLVHIGVSGRLLPQLFEASISRPLVKPLLRFGGGMLASTLALSLLGNLEKLILPALVSVEFLAYYSIAFTFASMSTLFTSAMMQSLIPAFSQLLAAGKEGELQRLYRRSIKVNIIGLLAFQAFLIVIAKPFFTIWAGPEFGVNSPPALYVLLFGLMFNIIAYVPYAVLVAAGRTDIVAKLYWIELVPYVIVVFVLIGRFGYIGAALAWSLRIIVDGISLLVLARRFAGVHFDFRRHLLSFALAAAVLLPPVLIVLLGMETGMWFWLIALMSAAAYGTLVWRLLLDADERAWAWGQLSAVTGRAA